MVRFIKWTVFFMLRLFRLENAMRTAYGGQMNLKYMQLFVGFVKIICCDLEVFRGGEKREARVRENRVRDSK